MLFTAGAWVVVDRTGAITLLGPVTIDPSSGQASVLRLLKYGNRQWEMSVDNRIAQIPNRGDLSFSAYDIGFEEPVSVLLLALNERRGNQIDGRMYKRAVFNSSLEVMDYASFSKSVSVSETVNLLSIVSTFGPLHMRNTAQFYSNLYISSQRPGFPNDLVNPDPNLRPALSVQGGTFVGGQLFVDDKVSFQSDISIASFTRLASCLSVSGTLWVGNSTSIAVGVYVGGATKDGKPTGSLSVRGRIQLSQELSSSDSMVVSSLLSIRSDTRLGSSVSSYGRTYQSGCTTVTSFGIIGSSLSVRAVLRSGSSVSASGDTTVGGSASVGSQLHVGRGFSTSSEIKISNSQSLGGSLNVAGGVSAGDLMSLASAFSLNSFARFGSSISISRSARAGGGLSLFEALAVGDQISVRQAASLGRSVSADARSEIGGALSVTERVTSGSSLSLRSLQDWEVVSV